jgi:hypothetical protein
MNLTGNEVLSTNSVFLNEIRKNYDTPNLPVNTLRSVTFSTPQIMKCFTSESVGIGFVRIVAPSSTPWLTSIIGGSTTDSLLVGVPVDTGGTIIGGGVSALSTCPNENCPHFEFKDRYEETQFETISIAEISRLKYKIISSSQSKFVSAYFSRKVIFKILSQSGCKGIMVFLVTYSNGYDGSAICGINADITPQMDDNHMIAYSDIYI